MQLDLQKYPKRNEDIIIEDYHNLVLKVYCHMIAKFGTWLQRYKQDLIQSGYCGLIKAKEKYEPGRGSFLGLAWLRIQSAMQSDIAKYAKFETYTMPIEDLKLYANAADSEQLDWQDLIPSEMVDYESVLRMITDPDDQKLLEGIIEMYPYWKLRKILGETKEEHDARVARLKDELREILRIFHPSN